MAVYKLVYFNARGSAEVLRFIFAQAGVTYDDKRIEKHEWPAVKPTTPTGQLPQLEVDNKIVTGCRPIAQFLAGRFGLAGNNDLEHALLSSIVDYLFDFMQKLAPSYCEKDAEKKAAMLENIKTESIPKYWSVISKKIEDNNSEAGWIFGDKPTYADFFLYCMVEHIATMFPGFLEQYPAVAKNKAAVEILPNIAKWLKERPVTEH